jgi:hypothetical protein
MNYKVLFYARVHHIHCPYSAMAQAVVASLLPRKHGVFFICSPVHVRLVAEKAKLWQDFLLACLFSPVSIISQIFYSHFALCVTLITRTSCRSLGTQIVSAVSYFRRCLQASYLPTLCNYKLGIHIWHILNSVLQNCTLCKPEEGIMCFQV